MKAVFRALSWTHVVLSYDDNYGNRVKREFMKRRDSSVFEIFDEKLGDDKYVTVCDCISHIGEPITSYGPLVNAIRAEYKAMKSAQKKAQAKLDAIGPGPGARYLGSAACGI